MGIKNTSSKTIYKGHIQAHIYYTNASDYLVFLVPDRVINILEFGKEPVLEVGVLDLGYLCLLQASLRFEQCKVVLERGQARVHLVKRVCGERRGSKG